MTFHSDLLETFPRLPELVTAMAAHQLGSPAAQRTWNHGCPGSARQAALEPVAWKPWEPGLPRSSEAWPGWRGARQVSWQESRQDSAGNLPGLHRNFFKIDTFPRNVSMLSNGHFPVETVPPEYFQSVLINNKLQIREHWNLASYSSDKSFLAGRYLAQLIRPDSPLIYASFTPQ